MLFPIVAYRRVGNITTYIMLIPELIVIFLYTHENLNKNVTLGLLISWSLWQSISRLYSITKSVAGLYYNAFTVLIPMITIALVLTIKGHR